MNKYYDLEINILSCLLQKPELMNKLILEDKYFIKTQRLWKFMKAFYDKFNTFDLGLMYSVCKDKYRLMDYLELVIDAFPPSEDLFEKMQKQLILLYNESKKEKWIIEKIFELSNQLYVRNIKLDDFLININDIYDKANELFKKEDDK